MRMSKEATQLRRDFINDILHIYKLSRGKKIKELSEVLRVSPSTVREIHKKYCNLCIK